MALENNLVHEIFSYYGKFVFNPSVSKYYAIVQEKASLIKIAFSNIWLCFDTSV